MAETTKDAQKSDSKPSLSCYQCKARKLKCDRARPVCGRCIKSADDCRYPESRERPIIVAKRPKVKELQARLTDLERRLDGGQSASSPVSWSSLSHPEMQSQLVGSGRFEQLPPQALIDELTNFYFARIHCEAPMLHPSRYVASLYLPPHMRPPMCLQYAVMATAARLSPVHKQLALPFYRRARQYIEFDEIEGDGQRFVTLGHAQCWAILATFEAQNLWFSKASMSVSRSVRLAQILGLHNLDGVSRLGTTLLPPKDWCEKEDRRRTLWAILCTDRLSSSTTGWPVMMDNRTIQTLLPASEEAFLAGTEEHSITLNEALSHKTARRSAFACRIVAAHLFHECLEHTYGGQHDDIHEEKQRNTFWSRHLELDNALATAFVTLPDNIRCPYNIHDPTAVFVNLSLHTATICIHRAGVAKAKQHNVGIDLLSRTQARLLPAAQEILALVTALTDAGTLFRSPFVPFAAFMASSIFLEDFIMSQNRRSEESMGHLMDLMVVVGSENHIAASLAVQMAHELKGTGVDPSALDKVKDLMAKMDPNMPLLGKTDHASGNVVFCPFQPPVDPVGSDAPWPWGTPVSHASGPPWSLPSSFIF